MTNQHTEACGCIVAAEPGHVHTKLCDTHRRETFFVCEYMPTVYTAETDNLDLIGG